MKNNKKLKAIVAVMTIVILIQIAYLSYSYLQDKKVFDTTVDISVGYIQITKIDDIWKYSSTGIDINNERGTETLTDSIISSNGKLRPGDMYSKTVSIKNTGDLSANIRISPKLSNDLITAEDSEVPSNKLFLLKIDNVSTTGVTPAPTISLVNGAYELNNINPNGEVTFDITFEVNKNYVENSGTSDKTFSSKVFSVTVDAVQTNAPFPTT